VWNECWSRRPDLVDSQYNGWQSVDATPQEASDGKMQCGPCPQIAIKNGVKGIQYDLEFIFAEVSAVVNYWKEKDDESGECDLIKVEKDVVGKKISTKSVGNNNRNDITLEYKYPEGSIAEEVAYDGASSNGDVSCTIEVKENIQLGAPVDLKVSVQRGASVGNKPLHANIQLVVNAVSYAGRREPILVKDIKGTLEVPSDPNQTAALHLTIKADEYTSLLKGDSHFNIRSFIVVEETNQTAVLEKEFVFSNQPILVDYLGTLAGLRVGTKGKARITYINPLSIPLTQVLIKVEGQGLTDQQVFKIGTINPGETKTVDFEIQALEEQNHFLIASLDSKELSGVTGQLELFVLSK